MEAENVDFKTFNWYKLCPKKIDFFIPKAWADTLVDGWSLDFPVIENGVYFIEIFISYIYIGQKMGGEMDIAIKDEDNGYYPTSVFKSFETSFDELTSTSRSVKCIFTAPVSKNKKVRLAVIHSSGSRRINIYEGIIRVQRIG